MTQQANWWNSFRRLQQELRNIDDELKKYDISNMIYPILDSLNIQMKSFKDI